MDVFSILCQQFYFMNISYQLGVKSKLDVPYTITYFIWTPIVEWYVVWCGYKDNYHKMKKKKDHVLNLFNNHSRLNRQHTWENF